MITADLKDERISARRNRLSEVSSQRNSISNEHYIPKNVYKLFPSESVKLCKSRPLFVASKKGTRVRAICERGGKVG